MNMSEPKYEIGMVLQRYKPNLVEEWNRLQTFPEGALFLNKYFPRSLSWSFEDVAKSACILENMLKEE